MSIRSAETNPPVRDSRVVSGEVRGCTTGNNVELAREWQMACATLLIGLNLIILGVISGLSLYAGGMVLKQTLRTKVLNVSFLKTPGALVLVTGLVTLVPFVCGLIYMIKKEGTVIKLLFRFFLFVIFACLLAATVLYCVEKPMLTKFINSTVVKLVHDYNTTKYDVDFFQQKFKCCGATSPSDFSPIPDSCCRGNKCAKGNVFKEGCVTKLYRLVDAYKTYFIAGVVVVGVVMVAGIFAAYRD